MRRREFITFIGAATSPLMARAQRPIVPVVGFLHIAKSSPYAPMLEQLRAGMKELGYVEGQNVAIEHRWADNQGERLPSLAADLVSREMAVILANVTVAAMAAKAATTKIPVVFMIAGDPVELGLVAGLGRPGGNVTGATFYASQLASRQLELLHWVSLRSLGFFVAADGLGCIGDAGTVN